MKTGIFVDLKDYSILNSKWKIVVYENEIVSNKNKKKDLNNITLAAIWRKKHFGIGGNLSLVSFFFSISCCFSGYDRSLIVAIRVFVIVVVFSLYWG